MSNTVIKVENLSKQYRLGQVGTGTLSHDINRLWHRLRGNDDPYLKIGEENKRDLKGTSEYVWALKELNFDIQQGDRVGIIGRNGAGKSTLLKILSRTTSPSKGAVKIKGRVASLLEVGTGFHPELSGRDNIFLNGAILGMSKRDIKNCFDEIVQFSGVERYINTPVKRYSSGMYVRLAFAVAAYLQSDILIVDEVLAVGDAEFQKKCLGKMGEVSEGEGRTVLFVSHNMSAIQKLCNKGLFLENGSLKIDDSINKAVDSYLISNVSQKSEYFLKSCPELSLYAESLSIHNNQGSLTSEIAFGESWEIRVRFKVLFPSKNVVIGLGLMSQLEAPVRTSWQQSQDFDTGDYIAVFKEKNILLATGNYRFIIGITVNGLSIQYIDDNLLFTISDVSRDKDDRIIKTSQTGLILNQMEMFVSKND